MIRFNKHIMKEGKCAVCRSTVMIDEIGNGDVCPKCGWHQDAAAIELPNQILLTNMISLNKAKKLYSEGKPLAPEFNDFLEFCDDYNEVEFSYGKKQYCVTKSDDDIFALYECGNNAVLLGKYQSIEDFAHNASIAGTLIKDLWGNIKEFGWSN